MEKNPLVYCRMEAASAVHWTQHSTNWMFDTRANNSAIYLLTMTVCSVLKCTCLTTHFRDKFAHTPSQMASFTEKDGFHIPPTLSPHIHTPFPLFSPSLISIMVSVDVKYHVYFTSHPPSPHLQELEAGEEVIDVGAKGFQGGVGHLHPHARDLALQDAQHHLLQVRGHHHQTLQQHKPRVSVDFTSPRNSATQNKTHSW